MDVRLTGWLGDPVDLRLVEWLRDHAGLTVTAVEPLGAAGRSNVHHRVHAGDESYVLRRPPDTGRLPTAHDMAREHAVLQVLSARGVPVPTPILLCTDTSVLGVPFLLMTECPGTVVKGQWPAPPRSRSTACASLVEALAGVHAVEWPDTPLRAYDRPEPYATRQLRRLSRQWTHAEAGESPVLREVQQTLADRFAEPPTREATVIHGDYGLHNVVLTPEGRVAAVLDWELWTVGDPLADLAWLLALWAEPDDPPDRLEALGPLAVTTAEGSWSRARLAAEYRRHTGADLTDLPRYLALSFYKLAVIRAGIVHRLRTGPNPEAAAEVDHRAHLALRAALAELTLNPPEPTRRPASA